MVPLHEEDLFNFRICPYSYEELIIRQGRPNNSMIKMIKIGSQKNNIVNIPKI